MLNFKGNLNCMIGSKVTTVLLEGWILPIGGVASGRVCACSLRSRLVILTRPVFCVVLMYLELNVSVAGTSEHRIYSTLGMCTQHYTDVHNSSGMYTTH